MDVPRTGVAAKKRKRRIMIIAASALGLILATIGISRLKPAVPSVDRSTVWIDTVKRGPMVRQVRGLGTLVPNSGRLTPPNNLDSAPARVHNGRAFRDGFQPNARDHLSSSSGKVDHV